MSQQEAGSKKFILESGGEDVDPVYDFLKQNGVQNPVRKAIFGGNGHKDTKTWIGPGIDVDINDLSAVINCGKTGCLIIEQGIKKTTMFIKTENTEEMVEKTGDKSDIDSAQSSYLSVLWPIVVYEK